MTEEDPFVRALHELLEVGRQMTAEDLRELAELCRRNPDDLAVIERAPNDELIAASPQDVPGRIAV